MMIRPAFNIGHEQASPDDLLQSLLLMEVNTHGMSYLVLNQGNKQVLDAKYYALHGPDSKSLSDKLRLIIDADDTLQSQFRDSVVLYNFPESQLVPDDSFNLEINRDLIELTHGTVGKGLILSEKIPRHTAHNVYRVAPDVHALFQQKFTAGKYWHIYSLWLCALKDYPPETENQQPVIHVLFYPETMLVAVYRKSKLHLVQTYNYQVAEDAVYYLLNICKQLELSPEEALLVISGYAQEDSVLIIEIKKYFLHYRMDQMPDNVNGAEFDTLPVHFFSPLLKMALCV